MARQVGGTRTALPTNEMVIIPDFVAMAGDFTFTVSFNSYTATTTEEVWIRSAPTTSSSTSAAASTTLATTPTTPATSPTTPTTRHPLLCYKGRQIDDTDLLRLSTKLFGLLALTTSRNNNRRKERRYDSRDHHHDNKSSNSPDQTFVQR